MMRVLVAVARNINIVAENKINRFEYKARGDAGADEVKFKKR